MTETETIRAVKSRWDVDGSGSKWNAKYIYVLVPNLPIAGRWGFTYEKGTLPKKKINKLERDRSLDSHNDMYLFTDLKGRKEENVKGKVRMAVDNNSNGYHASLKIYTRMMISLLLVWRYLPISCGWSRSQWGPLSLESQSFACVCDYVYDFSAAGMCWAHPIHLSGLPPAFLKWNGSNSRVTYFDDLNS